VAVAGKIFGAMFINEPIAERLLIGIAMVPRGEVRLILAELGRTGGVFKNEIYAGMILVISIYYFTPPYHYKYFLQKTWPQVAGSS